VATDAAPCRLAAGPETTVTEALRETLRGELERDERRAAARRGPWAVYGGAFGVSRGLLEQFGASRVRETPISENGFTGLAVGAAVGGFRPVVELMFSDFVTCCMDALVNHAAKLRYMYAGQVSVPLTMRLPIGRRHGYGATHSQSLEAWFLHVPGLAVVCPSNVEDAVGLLRTAIRTDAPVLFLEPKLLYPARGPMPAADHLVPLGKARIERQGRHVTLVFTYGQCMPLCIASLPSSWPTQGIEAGIVDLRIVGAVRSGHVCGRAAADGARHRRARRVRDRGCRGRADRRSAAASVRLAARAAAESRCGAHADAVVAATRRVRDAERHRHRRPWPATSPRTTDGRAAAFAVPRHRGRRRAVRRVARGGGRGGENWPGDRDG
jgi:pyruvate/2-oxoglutarate/acetoin dehydrogenase E1 component